MKVVKRILVVLLVILIIIQFFHPNRNLLASQSPTDISRTYPVSDNVEGILKKACKDCHSDSTRYPWYANVQPTAWYLADHIKDGKRQLNLSEFTTYSIARQYHKLDEVIDQVKKDEMPLKSYLLIHTDAKLSQDEKNTLINWADSLRQIIRSKYPPDSLIRKK